MIDLSQANDRININTLCTKLKRTELPDQITNIMEYIFGRTIVNTVYGAKPSEFWPVVNETRQWGLTFGNLYHGYIS